MKTAVINLSHPLTPEQIEQIASLIAAWRDDVGDVAVHTIPVQIDFTDDVFQQLFELWIEKVAPIIESDADIFIMSLPGLSIAAAYIAAAIARWEVARAAGKPVYAVIMRRREGIVNIYDVVDLWRIV